MKTLVIIRGDTFRRTFQAKAGGTAVPLTGASVAMEARERPRGPVVLTLNPEITTAATGIVTVEMSPAETAAIPRIGRFITDIKFTLASGDVKHSATMALLIADAVTE